MTWDVRQCPNVRFQDPYQLPVFISETLNNAPNKENTGMIASCAPGLYRDLECFNEVARVESTALGGEVGGVRKVSARLA